MLSLVRELVTKAVALRVMYELTTSLAAGVEICSRDVSSTQVFMCGVDVVLICMLHNCVVRI